MSRPLEGSVALVTGASRGIGAAAAIALAGLGAHIVGVARTQGGLEETDDAIRAAGGATTLLPLDLLEGDQVDMIGPTLFDRFGRLDVVVHAAATLGKLTPVPHILTDDWSEVVGVNLTAGLRIIRTTAPLLVAAPAGRAVFLTDARASEPGAYWAPYAATKAGLQHLALSWAAEIRTTRLRVNLFDPGAVATRLRRRAFPGEDQAVLPRPEDVAPGIAALCLPAEERNGAIVAFSPGPRT
jgi:NAD(P)-dependent dehydrogenase (short-subunit alcohol dehydrogenase family)